MASTDTSGSLFIRIAITILFTCVLVLFAVAAFSSSDEPTDDEHSLRTICTVTSVA